MKECANVPGPSESVLWDVKLKNGKLYRIKGRLWFDAHKEALIRWGDQVDWVMRTVERDQLK